MYFTNPIWTTLTMTLTKLLEQRNKMECIFNFKQKKYFIGHFEDLKDVTAYNAKTVEVHGENNKFMHVFKEEN